MESLTKPYDYLAGLYLLRQDYLADLSELKSASGLTDSQLDLLRTKLADEHRLRCAQEWKAISAQLRADRDVRT